MGVQIPPPVVSPSLSATESGHGGRIFSCGFLLESVQISDILHCMNPSANQLDLHTSLLLARLSILCPDIRLVWRTPLSGGDVLESTTGRIVTADSGPVNGAGLCPCPACATARLNERVRAFWANRRPTSVLSFGGQR